jgi:hypothetical protein
LLLLSFLLWVPSAHAASLFLNPSNGTYAVGSVISVDILVNTEGETVNAISGDIAYPPSILSPVSVDTNNSIVTLWVARPTAVPKGGLVSFEGLILNPGFLGEGRVATVRFEVLDSGVANMVFDSGSVLANNGYGTNIARALVPATFTLSGNTSDRIAAGNPSLPVDPNKLVLDTLRPPVVTNYTSTPKTLRDFFVQGITYPNAGVKLWIKGSTGNPQEFTLSADGAGNFSYRYSANQSVVPLLQAAALDAVTGALHGIPYRFWLAASVDGTDTPPTQSFEMTVGGIGIPELLLMIIVLLIIGVAALVAFEMVLLRRVYEHDVEKEAPFSSDRSGINRSHNRRDL